MTHADDAAAGGADARAAALRWPSASSSTPSQAASRQTRSRSDAAVLADAGGEHDRVEPAERGGERAQLAPDAVDEQVDRGLARPGRRSPRSVRMSLEMPDTPSSPDCW